MGGWNLKNRNKSENFPKAGMVVESMRIRTYYLILSSFSKISYQPSLELRNDGISMQWNNRVKKDNSIVEGMQSGEFKVASQNYWLVGEICALPLAWI